MGRFAATVQFRMYANYAAFIERAEVRIFDHEQSLQSAPLAIVEVDRAGLGEWQPGSEHLAGPEHELKYVLRAYDANGNFDETDAQPLWLYHETAREETVAREGEESPVTPAVRLPWLRRRRASCWRPTARAVLHATTFRSAADGQGAGQRHTGQPHGLGGRPAGAGGSGRQLRGGGDPSRRGAHGRGVGARRRGQRVAVPA